MRRRWWLFGGAMALIVLVAGAFAFVRQPASDDLRALQKYAVSSKTSYVSADDVARAGVSGKKPRAIRMRSLRLRNITRGELFRLMNEIKAKLGWHEMPGLPGSYYLISPTGALARPGGMFDEQISVAGSSENFDLQLMADNVLVDVQIFELRDLSWRDQIALRLTHLGKDPFVKP